MIVASTLFAERVEQSIGIALMLLVLIDVFLTVLYARMGTSLIARWACVVGFRLFRHLGRMAGARGSLIMTICGPFLLVLIVALWAALLTLGAALVIHPALGSAVRESQGETGTDFITALHASGTSLALVGGSSSSPKPDFPIRAALAAARVLPGPTIRTLGVAALGTAAGVMLARRIAS
jgi:hypothetical protein